MGNKSYIPKGSDICADIWSRWPGECWEWNRVVKGKMEGSAYCADNPCWSLLAIGTMLKQSPCSASANKAFFWASLLNFYTLFMVCYGWFLAKWAPGSCLYSSMLTMFQALTHNSFWQLPLRFTYSCEFIQQIKNRAIGNTPLRLTNIYRGDCELKVLDANSLADVWAQKLLFLPCIGSFPMCAPGLWGSFLL